MLGSSDLLQGLECCFRQDYALNFREFFQTYQTGRNLEGVPCRNSRI